MWPAAGWGAAITARSAPARRMARPARAACCIRPAPDHEHPAASRGPGLLFGERIEEENPRAGLVHGGGRDTDRSDDDLARVLGRHPFLHRVQRDGPPRVHDHRGAEPGRFVHGEDGDLGAREGDDRLPDRGSRLPVLAGSEHRVDEQRVPREILWPRNAHSRAGLRSDAFVAPSGGGGTNLTRRRDEP